MEWKKIINKDGSVMLFGGFKVSGLEDASSKAIEAVKIIKSYREDKHSHLAISSEGLIIALHGISKDKIDASDWVIAKKIKQVLEE